jgi:hypothetical protein
MPGRIVCGVDDCPVLVVPRGAPASRGSPEKLGIARSTDTQSPPWRPPDGNLHAEAHVGVRHKRDRTR